MAEIFLWKPDADQVFDDRYESQTQTGAGADFNKYTDRKFVMDAAGRELVLMANEDAGPNFTDWPDPDSSFNSGEYPEIIIKQGILKISGLTQFNCGAAKDPYYPKLASVIVKDNGHMVVESQFVYLSSLKIDTGTQPKISVTENGVFDIDASYIYAPSGHIYVSDDAVVNFWCDQFFSELGTFLPDETLPPRFTLGAGSPLFNFNKNSNASTLVDFENLNYQEGIFNFDLGSKGKFVFQGIGSARQFSSLIDKKLVAVNGNSNISVVKSFLNMDSSKFISNGDLVLQLK
jgi:hypothetical protein